MTTPVSSEAAAGAHIPPNKLSLGARLTGVVRRPGSTFSAIAAAPAWAGALTVTTLAIALSGVAVAGTEVGQTALVDQWERTAFAFGHEVSQAEYARLLQLARYGAAYATASAVGVGPLLAVVLAVVAHLALAGGAPGRPTIAHALAVTTHAGVILALRQLIAAPASYLRETTANATALGVWFPVADAGTALGRFLNAVDLFVIWWVVVVAIGLSVVYRRRVRTIAAALLGIYVAGAGLMTLAMETAAAASAR